VPDLREDIQDVEFVEFELSVVSTGREGQR